MAKSYKEKFKDEDGVWRTIGGRRVFIREGQSLSDAMKESKKFKKTSEITEKFADLKSKFSGDNREKIKEETRNYLSSLDNGTELGLVTKETVSGWTSHGGYSDEYTKLNRYQKIGKNQWQTPRGIKTDDDMVLTALYNENSLRDLKSANSMKNKLEVNDKSYTREIVNVGEDKWGNKIGKSTNKVKYRNNPRYDLADKIAKGDMKYTYDLNDQYSVGDYDNGYYVQFQDIEKNSGTQDLFTHKKLRPKTESYTWGRVWKDKELVYNTENSKYGARQDVINYLRDKDDDNALYEEFKQHGGTWQSFGEYKAMMRANKEKNNELMFENAMKQAKEGKYEDLNKINEKTTYNFGKIDAYGNGRKMNKATVEMQLKDGTFTASGNIWNSKGTDIISGGQNLEEMKEYLGGNKEFDRIYDMWKKHHLNDMHAGTERQEEALINKFGNMNASNYSDHVSYLKSIGIYEDNGYKYGTGWLKREIPQEDLENITDLIRSNNTQPISLEQRYKGTIEYLKNTTNMSGAEILEMLKKMDK